MTEQPPTDPTRKTPSDWMISKLTKVIDYGLPITASEGRVLLDALAAAQLAEVALRARVTQLEAQVEEVLNHLTFEDLQAAGYRDRITVLEARKDRLQRMGIAETQRADAAEASLMRIAELHQPREVRHWPIGTELGDDHRPIAGQPFEVKLHCGACECGQDDWPCATSRALLPLGTDSEAK